MRKLGLILIPLLIVACGKNEVLTKAKEVAHKSINDGVSTVSKAINDTAAEIDRSTDSVITKTNDAKNEVLSNTGNFGESLGQGIEAIGQAPKKALNQLLGNDEESEEKQRSLENDLELTQEELAALQNQVNEMYQEFIEQFAEVSFELGDLKSSIARVESENSEANRVLVDALESIHTELLQKINRLDRKDRKALSKIRKLQSKLRNLKRDLRQLSRTVDNLETICYTYSRGYYYHYNNFRTYCNIVSDEDEDEWEEYDEY